MKTRYIHIFAAIALCASASLAGAQETLAIGTVQATKALTDDMARKGKTIEMQRVVEAVDHNLISALTQTRKFKIVGRSDLKDLLKEQDLGNSGIVDAGTAAEQGKVKGAKYRLVTTVDHFLEENAAATFASGRKATKRRFQLSGQAVIYDASTSEVLDSSNFKSEKTDVIDLPDGQVTDAKRTDDLMPAVVLDISKQVANRTVEVLTPAKIIDIEDKVATINRGDSLGLQKDQVWDVFGPSKTVTDPDSGATIKIKGKRIGKLKITSVDAMSSQGEIIEGTSVVVGAVLSKPQ